MIWYDFNITVSGFIFVLLLLTAALQTVIVLAAGDLAQNRHALFFLRLFYSLLAIFSICSSYEMLLVIASVEGGLYLNIASSYRYLAIVPPLFYIYLKILPLDISVYLRPLGFSFFAPLLRLPLLERLPPPIPAALAIFGFTWLFLDCVHTLISYKRVSDIQITRGDLLQVIHRFSYGIAVIGRGGWILESNPAFYKIAASMGLKRPDNLADLENDLEQSAEKGNMEIKTLDNGRSINTDDRSFFLQKSEFRTGRKKYLQLTISDVTRSTQATNELTEKNTLLSEKNKALEKALAGIEREEIVRQREEMNRRAHDTWSQRLAVAGISLDRLLGDLGEEPAKDKLAQIASLLDINEETDRQTDEYDLAMTLKNLAKMYQQLGVNITIKGKTEFTRAESKALCSIVREALANAVRHAYARNINVEFFTQITAAGINIENDCLDPGTHLEEGRGMHDMKARANDANGQLSYIKGSKFSLTVSFPRKEAG